MGRREFGGKALLAMLAGVTVTVTGCSGSPAEPDPPVPDRAGVVENNHGHVATITAAQQTSKGGVTINIQGTSGHDHVLELTASEVIQIRWGTTISKQCAMSRNHYHTITFN